MRDESSRLRKALLDSSTEQQRQLERLVGERGPLMHAALGTRGRVCGSPGCHCSRGELHESKFLSATIGGRTRQVHVPAGDEVEVSRWVERHKKFRESRARLAELTSRQLDLVDRLGRSLLAVYPKDNPLPPPRPRGRPAKTRKDKS
jgi:hypothetical protein